MRYTEFLKPSEGFQYSINLQYDLGSNIKIQGYIPTANTIGVLKNYLKAIYEGVGDKATVLVGPYGKGKSHLLLILLTMIQNKKENLPAIKSLIEKIEAIDEKTAQLCRMIIENNIKLLPVVVNSSYSDLHQSFLIALYDSLNKNGLIDIMPNTYFDSVISVINKWKIDFPETIKVLKKGLKDNGITLTVFEEKISNYDQKAYEIFREIYLTISSGIEYNPLINSDITKLYDETNFILCEKHGYNGMFIVFDEFSKFMESSVTNNTISDIKILQDFAELAGRTSNKQQLHITCITHKTINEYVSKLPKEIINAWRGIEGRFKEFYMTSSSKQNYDLISNAIIKDEVKLEEFIEKNLLFSKLSNSYGLFEDMFNEQEYKEKIGVGCFPLNPISTFALPKISEKVAQNERTLFTFLCKNELHTLVDFINKNTGKLKLLNLNVIFDYFESLFKKEIFNEFVHQIWLKADVAIRKCHFIGEKNILKALAIIYIINEFDLLAPTIETLTSALDVLEGELDKFIEPMIKSNIIYIKRSNGHINFAPITQYNIREKLELIKNTKIKNVNIPQELEKIYDLGYVLPKRYNDEFKMVRFFRSPYVTVQQLESFQDFNSLVRHYDGDGVIANLIYFNEEEKERAIEKVKSLSNERLILCVPSAHFNKYDSVIEYAAIQVLKQDTVFINEDPVALQLVEIIEEDIMEDLKAYLQTYYVPENRSCNYYINEEKLIIYRKSDLNKKVSDICFKHFDETPKVNNEMINKNIITSVISKARQKVVEYLIESYNNERIQTLSGRGPEVTIYRTTIENFGLGEASVSKDVNLNAILNIIRSFIISSEKAKKCFSELYDQLLGEGIGIRKGIIPIYIAYVLREFNEETILYFGSRGNKEVNFNYDTLNNINEQPNDYYIRLEKGTKEREEYINSLIKLFDKEINQRLVKTNRFTAIGTSMQTYVQSLSHYARTHRENINGVELDESIFDFRSELLKFDLNHRDFLFRRLLKLTESQNYIECYKKIKNIKEYLDLSITELNKYLIKETNNIVNPQYKGSLSQNLKRWYSEHDENRKNHLYDVTTNKTLKFIEDLESNDDIYVINKLASIITGLNIEDWQENTIKMYLNDLQHSLNEVNDLQFNFEDGSQNLYKIEVNQNGDVVEKSFEETDISEIGVTLMNELEELFEEYGASIEANEKRNILIKMLQRYM